MARAPERRDSPVDGAAVDQRALRKPGIEGHPELGQVFADVGEDAAERVIQHAAKRRIAEQQPGRGR